MQDVPEPLAAYANDPNSSDAKHYARECRRYNAQLAFGIIGKERDPQRLPPGVPVMRVNGMFTHEICNVNPLPYGPNVLQFQQHFVVDPEDALIRVRSSRHRGKIREHVFLALLKMLKTTHPFAQAFINCHDLLRRYADDNPGEVPLIFTKNFTAYS